MTNALDRSKRLQLPWLALIILFSAGCEPAATGIAIENVTVVDPVAGMLARQRVVIRGDRIVSVTAQADAADPVATTVDGTNQFLIPGLWDMHVHFLYERALRDEMASLFLDYGITSVRDTGGDLLAMRRLTQAMAADPAPEPNIFFAGPLLDGRFVVYDGGDPGRPKLGKGIPDAETARAYIQELKAAGASLIKIYELVSPAVFEVLAAEARKAELPIASHVPLMMTADAAGPLTDSMEHLRNIELACAANWDDLLAQRQKIIGEFVEGRGYDLRRSLHSLQRIPAIEAYDEARCDQVLARLTRTIQVPTLRLNTLAVELPFADPDWPRALAGLPAELAEAWQTQADELTRAAPVADPTFSRWSQFLIGRLKANGVPIGAGTDTPIGLGIPGWSLHTELAQLVDAGLTPQEALYAATVQAARFMRLEEETGQVAAGMQADLLLLSANPLDDIANTRKIERVMLGGEWVR